MLNRFLVYVFERLALNNFVMSRLDRAERHFERVVRLAPEKSGYRYNLALCKMGLGKFAEAEALLLAYIEEEGEGYPPRRALADLHYFSGEREKAGKSYAACLRKAKESEKPLLTLRRDICSDKAAYADAARAAKLYEEGTALFNEKPDEAFELFRQAARLDPSHFPSLNNMGAICMNIRRDYLGARGYFERSLALSDQPVVRKNLAKLDKAQGAL